MIYHRAIPIEFNHCDPAGIVFYPRYFEMINSVAENFFKDVVRESFADMVASRHGVPTLRVETAFHLPSRLGEVLDFQLCVHRLGTTSISLDVTAFGGTKRLSARLVLVRVGPDIRPEPWPAVLRDRIEAFTKAVS